MNKLSTVVFFLSACFCAGDVCNVIPAEDDIDWKRMEGSTWYQVMNIGDPESKTSCHTIQFLDSNEAKIGVNFKLLDDSNPENTDVVREDFIKTGKFYTMNKVYEKHWMGISVRRQTEKNPKLVDEIVNETKDRFIYPIALYTDYETYFIGTRCTPKHHYVFAYAKTPHLTPPVALSIFNTLVKSNNAVELELASCKDIENIQNYT